MLFTINMSGAGRGARLSRKIAVQSLETGEKKILVEGGSNAHYAPTGHLVYAGDAGYLLAVPFDLTRLEVTGQPVPIIEGVVISVETDGAQFSFSRTGTLIYVPGRDELLDQMLVWVDRRGNAEPVAGLSGPIRWGTRLSPDGRRLALSMRGSNPDIWIYELSRGTLTRLTFAPGLDEFPVWSPDGQRVAFGSVARGQLLWKATDGSGPEEPLLTDLHHPHMGSWSPDGKVLAFEDQDPETGWDIWMLPLEGERKPQLFLRTPFRDSTPMFSPDGRWIAHISTESGRKEVYVRPFPGPGGKWQISTDGGVDPTWAPDGRELFYRSGNRTMVVAIETEPTFSAGRARFLFEGDYEGPYAITPDGQRLLMMKASKQQASTAARLNVVVNWFDELQSLVPTGKK